MKSPSPERYSNVDPEDELFAVKAVDAILNEAISVGASDIHLNPGPDSWEIFFRIDGVLAGFGKLQRKGEHDPVTRLMVLAGLPTYRDGHPMEGRLRWPETSEAESSDRRQNDVSFRLGVFPTVHGARAVIRLLRKDDRFDSIDSLGLDPDAQDRLIEMTMRTDGAILMTGPTGSGKTTTLYAMLRRIAAIEPRRSVVTIEDPVESIIDTINQSELTSSGEMSLASALRSVVRQDSEVLLISEIRDPDTAHAVMHAALTGHLIFSSLHAGDVPSTLRRLIQLGVPAHAIHSGVTGVISQRLLRSTCTECAGTKCDACNQSGYRGRFPIASVVSFTGGDPVGQSLLESLQRDDSLAEMREVMKQPNEDRSVDLRTLALAAVDQGRTDEKEVYRVLG